MSLNEIQNLYKIYGEGTEQEVRALDGVSLTIDQGEFVAIIGQSGSGKSTLMNILGCLDVPTSGDYYLDGVSIRQRTQRELSELRSRRIGFIFQGYNLIPSLTVLENVALPMRYQKVPAAERRQGPQPSGPALRRPAAAGGHRPGSGHPFAHPHGRRAHRRPGFQNGRPGAGADEADQPGRHDGDPHYP